MSDSSTLRSISWRELFPWLIIFRSFRLSLGLTAMLAAVIGALLMPLGWKAAGAMFLDREQVARSNTMTVVVDRLETINYRSSVGTGLLSRVGILPNSSLHGRSGDWSHTFDQLALPVRNWFSLELSVPEFAYFLFGGLWSLAVWAFCGGIIVRQAIVKLSVGERIGLRSTVTHTVSKYLSYFSAPLFPLIVVVLISLPIALVGLLMRLGDVGQFIAALIWILVLIGGVIMAIAVLGLLFAWPLMWGAIATEKHSDAFDAVSRSYSYVFQRPLHYLFYAVVASLLGALCWMLVSYFEQGVIGLSWWSASFGSGGELATDLYKAVHDPNHGHSFGDVVISLFTIWEGVIRLLATAFRYSFFWTATAAIYLLLRYDADQTEIDDIYLDDEENARTLPTLDKDSQGVPQAPETPPGESQAEEQQPPSDDDEKPTS